MMRITLPIMLSILCACSISARGGLTQEQAYVAYTVSIANRVFPPDRYYTSLDLFYDAGALAYAKNDNSFWLRYHKPVIMRTDRGLYVRLGLLPSGYFESPCSITLYFIPVKSGAARISGELLTKEFEYHYGPRHKTEARPLEEREVVIRQGFEPTGDMSTGFMEYIRENKIYYTADTADGDYTKIHIPPHAALDSAVKSFLKLAGDKGFVKAGELRVPDGELHVFRQLDAAKRRAFELRALFESGKVDNSLHLSMYGTVRVREHLEAIDRRYREMLK